MTWDGKPENPERDGWHWLLWVGLFPADRGEETPRAYRWERDGFWEGSMHRHARYWTQGWTYLGPCLTPAEVAAREAAARRAALEEAAALVECGCEPAKKDAVEQARPNSAARWNACGEANCGVIEAAAIRALAQKDPSDAR